MPDPDREQLTGWLDRFSQRRQPGPYGYEHHHHHDGGSHRFHVVIGSLIHGNEVGSLPAVVSLIDDLATGSATYGGRLTVILGNPESGLADRRYLDSDLNRAFTAEPPAGHEGNRARRLKPILDEADVFFDLHQTIEDCDRAFYTFPFDRAGWHWARAVAGADTWATRPPGAGFSAGTVCADEYVRNRGKVGFTLELGPKGFDPAAERRARAALDRLLATADAVAADPAALVRAATAEPELTFVQTVARQPFDQPTMRLRPGLVNFQTVARGELLSAHGTPQLIAPDDGFLLFPKYPEYADDGTVMEPRPAEIFNLAQALEGHPTEVWAAELDARRP